MDYHKLSRFISMFCAVLLVTAASAARAQSGTDASMSDKHFVSEAIKGGLAEVQMGQLAEQKGNSGEVRNFGKKMVEDHTKLTEQMTQVASQIHVASPKSPTTLQQLEIRKLRGLSGDAFDQEFIKTMVKDHEADLKDFKKEATSGDSMLVKNAAQSGANVIDQHLSMIHQIADSRHIVAE